MLFLKKYCLCLEVLKSNFITFSCKKKNKYFLNICNYIENLKWFEMIQTKLKLFVCFRELFRDAFCIFRKYEGYTIEKKIFWWKGSKQLYSICFQYFINRPPKTPPLLLFLCYFFIKEGGLLLSSTTEDYDPLGYF